MNLKIISIACVASFLFISGCSKDEAKPKEKLNEKPLVEATDEFDNVFPLTGVATDKEVNQRAVAVMINNHPQARPQSGLQSADIVYEMLAEGDVTRFLAVYQSEHPERVGPVRSARDYYIKIAKGFESIYICHGFSPDAKEMLDEGYIDHLNGLYYDGSLFKRDKSRKAPHNSYISFTNIEKGAEENSFDLDKKTIEFPFLTEQEVEDIEGEEGTNISVIYGSSAFDVSYEYDDSEGKYRRFTDANQTIDQDTGKPVLLDNIVVMEAPHAIVDNEGRRNIDLSKGGNAYLLQKGKWNEIQWQFADNLITFMKDGEEAKLVPGKTWVNVVPDKPGLQSTVMFQ